MRSRSTAPRPIKLGALMIAAAALSACGPDPGDDPQRLIASGLVRAADTDGSATERVIAAYELDFTVHGHDAERVITRRFIAGTDGVDLTLDDNDRFEVRADDLALSYTWTQDELECGDVCVEWETVCDVYTEEVCTDVCTEQVCWDECTDDCTTECWEETECDDSGCYPVTVCEDSCSESCTTICEDQSYPCGCVIVSDEVCGDECSAIVEECAWVTRSYEERPTLAEVIDTEARLIFNDSSVGETSVTGDAIESSQHENCDAKGVCSVTNLWIQKDRFTVAPNAVD